MNDRQKLVSVGIPVYNGEQYIETVLASITKQTFTNLEILISDNASTDSTVEICLSFAKTDKRIKLFQNINNNGACWNFNHVFGLSTGDYFMWASHDDIYDPKYIEVCLEGFCKSQKVILSGTTSKLICPDSSIHKLKDYGLTTIGQSPSHRFKNYKRMIQGSPNTNCIFYGLHRTDQLKRVIPMRKLIGADHIMLSELSLIGEFYTTEEVLFTKRLGGASANHKKISQGIGLNNSFLGFFPYLVREFYMQAAIFLSDRMSKFEKLSISFWSITNYFIYDVLRAYYRLFKRFLPSPAKDILKKLCA